YPSGFNGTFNSFNGIFEKLKSIKDTILSNHPECIQYFYDFTDDLIKTCHEIEDKLAAIHSVCCADENLFPLHLCLGEADKNTDLFSKSQPYRHYFINSPLIGSEKDTLAEGIFLFEKIHEMIAAFEIPFFNDPKL